MTGAGAYDAVGRLHWPRSSPLPHTFLPEGEHMLPHEGKCHTQRPKDTAPVCVWVGGLDAGCASGLLSGQQVRGELLLPPRQGQTKVKCWPQKLKNGVGNVDMGDIGDMRETELKENYVDYVIVHGKSL